MATHRQTLSRRSKGEGNDQNHRQVFHHLHLCNIRSYSCYTATSNQSRSPRSVAGRVGSAAQVHDKGSISSSLERIHFEGCLKLSSLVSRTTTCVASQPKCLAQGGQVSNNSMKTPGPCVFDIILSSSDISVSDKTRIIDNYKGPKDWVVSSSNQIAVRSASESRFFII